MRGRARFLSIVPSAFLACFKYRILLWLRPVPTLNAPVPPVGKHSRTVPPSDISRAVYLASRFIPGASCLPQGLAVRELMARHGWPAELRLGAATSGGFRAHAWVTLEGEVIHGHTSDQFSPLEPRSSPSHQ